MLQHNEVLDGEGVSDDLEQAADSVEAFANYKRRSDNTSPMGSRGPSSRPSVKKVMHETSIP
jgi:hypothetical protein